MTLWEVIKEALWSYVTPLIFAYQWLRKLMRR